VFLEQRRVPNRGNSGNPSRVSGVIGENTLELQDMDSGVRRSECLHRLEKIWSGHLLEFNLGRWIDLYSKDKNWHRLFPFSFVLVF